MDFQCKRINHSILHLGLIAKLSKPIIDFKYETHLSVKPLDILPKNTNVSIAKLQHCYPVNTFKLLSRTAELSMNNIMSGHIYY